MASRIWLISQWLVCACLLGAATKGWAQPDSEALYFANYQIPLAELTERKEILQYRISFAGERRYRETYLDSGDLLLHQQQKFLRVKESFDGKAVVEFFPGGSAHDRTASRSVHSVALPAPMLLAARAGRFDDGRLLRDLRLPAGQKFDKVQLVAEFTRQSITLSRSGKAEFIISLLTGNFEGLTGRKLTKEFSALAFEPVDRRSAARQAEINRIADFLLGDLRVNKQTNSLYARGVEKVVSLRANERRLEPVRVLGGSRGSSADQFDEPDAVAFTLDGRLIAADTENTRFKIYRFDDNGQSVQIIGGEGSAPGKFDHSLVVKLRGVTIYNQVQGVAVDKIGLIYVIDQGNQRIQVFTADGKALPDRTIALKYCPAETPHCAEGLWRALKGQYTSLQGLAVDVDGGVFISDKGTSRIYRYLPNGQRDANFNLPEVEPETNKALLKEEESMALYQDKLFVANEGTGEIIILDRRTGAPVGPVWRFGAETLAGDVEGLAVLGDYLFVVDVQNSRIAVFDLKTTPPKFLLGFVGDHDSADGIAVDPTGKYIAIADQGHLRILLYSLPEILDHLATTKAKP